MTKRIENKYRSLQADLQEKAETGKLGMSLADYKEVCKLGAELPKHHAVTTVICMVATYFKEAGFMVTMDFDKVNYVIIEV